MSQNLIFDHWPSLREILNAIELELGPGRFEVDDDDPLDFDWFWIGQKWLLGLCSSIDEDGNREPSIEVAHREKQTIVYFKAGILSLNYVQEAISIYRRNELDKDDYPRTNQTS